MMRGFVVGSGVLWVLAFSATCQAHDLKVLLSRLASGPGSTETVYLSFGHVVPIDAQVDGASIDDYFVKTPSGSTLFLKKDGVGLHANELHVEEEGVYQAVAARKASIWCDVVDEQGNHRHHRGGRGTVTEGTVEKAVRSQMYAKALMVSGANGSALPEPLGHALEIVPLESPENWKAGRDLTFRVLLHGRPLNSEDLLATYVGFKPDKAWCFATSTDGKGEAVVRPSQAGTWILRVRSQRPAADTSQGYDVESYTATLVIEVRP
jgi:uncharacterized GH25 family protein